MFYDYSLEELNAKRKALVARVNELAAKITALVEQEADYWKVSNARNQLAVANSDVALCDAWIIKTKRGY